MADTTLPDEKGPIRIDLENLDLVPGTWIISAFLKCFPNPLLEVAFRMLSQFLD